MTRRHQQSARDAELARLLADVRHTEPIPVDVAERLDAVLGTLSADGAPEAVVVGLPAARRRRAAQLLVAAAAVVAVGVGGAQFISPDRSGVSAAGSADSEGNTGVSADSLASTAEAPAAIAPQARLVRLSDEGFARQVRKLRRSMLPAQIDGQAFSSNDLSTGPATVDKGGSSAGGSAGSSGDDPGSGTSDMTDSTRSAKSYAEAAGSCSPAAWGKGRKVAVLYHGEPAMLVFRPRMGDVQVVELLQCGTAQVLRSVTLR